MNQSRPPGTAPHPYTFRLPTKGVDPHYGLSRAWYYAAETKGLLNLIRLRERGKKSNPEAYAKGGSVSSASKRGDGIAQRGKTRGKMC